MSVRQSKNDRLEALSRVVTLCVTNAIKLGGLYIGFRAATKPTPDAVVLAYSAFMMAGAQFSESFALGILDRLFVSARRRNDDEA